MPEPTTRADESDIETETERVTDEHVRVTVSGVGRKVVHDFFICKFTVSEVERLYENGVIRAVFHTKLSESQLPKFSDRAELVEGLVDMAEDGPSLQVTEEFDASIEIYEEQTG